MSSVAHLDTSALVKRYVEERGSEGVDRLFDSAYRGRAILALSIFNVEAACALDKGREGASWRGARRAPSR
ncbi:MAG: hypothetical protein LM577_02890 [Thermoproteaceae archaeon]|nr:hypothetical protein [Thermoproteaceae archaeon]